MSNIIAVSEAATHLGKSNVVFADVRFVLGQPEEGRRAYEESHIPGAVFFDLDADLSGPKQKHGGGRPVPPLDELARKLGAAGIGDDTDVIVYDDQGGSIAGRLWWTLKYLGHERVRLLAEGFSGWRDAGQPVTDELPVPAGKEFVVRTNEAIFADIEDVKAGAGKEGHVLIDSRKPDHFTGEDTSKYAKAGHIPGAINRFWEAGSPGGIFQSAEVQRERFKDLPAESEIIVYCGGGVTATPNVLALTEAGYKNVKLYVGSWSDWTSYDENPVAVGEE
ncbi:sulfurtransferase [Cohnella sp. AR92]|uniref:sulfurtransferase n=1 Tax=Cohnella sp. AR92 TaxID=648716 RepID=UPI000F8DBC95|nr:sulfurtransferase [Cohnella sp. AR92]RUS47342.1 sulfurtransferase [Cohnella sp. AR92]